MLRHPVQQPQLGSLCTRISATGAARAGNTTQAAERRSNVVRREWVILVALALFIITPAAAGPKTAIRGLASQEYFDNYRNMKQKEALAALAALAQDTRLSVFRHLVVAGPEGAAAGEIAGALDVAPPTLSFHLKELEQAGLVTSRRESRSIIYAANYERMRALLSFLMEDCCRGNPEVCNVAPRRKEWTS
jgi:DNA-binding transcriptional ArsR family regulator